MKRPAKLTDGTIVTVLAIGFIGSILSDDGANTCFICEYPDGHTDWVDCLTFLSSDEIRNLWETGDTALDRDVLLIPAVLPAMSLEDYRKDRKLYESLRDAFMAGCALGSDGYEVLTETQLNTEFEAYLQTILAKDTPYGDGMIPS